jgi:hypothetical protein
LIESKARIFSGPSTFALFQFNSSQRIEPMHGMIAFLVLSLFLQGCHTWKSSSCDRTWLYRDSITNSENKIRYKSLAPDVEAESSFKGVPVLMGHGFGGNADQVSVVHPLTSSSPTLSMSMSFFKLPSHPYFFAIISSKPQNCSSFVTSLVNWLKQDINPMLWTY